VCHERGRSCRPAGRFAALAGIGWFFFAPRKAHTAELADGVQRVNFTVRGGYHPDVIRVRQGFRWTWSLTGLDSGSR
jgi:plastocyanin domain-containing protein